MTESTRHALRLALQTLENIVQYSTPIPDQGSSYIPNLELKEARRVIEELRGRVNL